MTRGFFAASSLLLALTMLYASTIVGPMGPHFVPVPPYEAVRRLIDIGFVAHGSDQQADWMGNLLMLVPLGFLTAGWMDPPPRLGFRRPRVPNGVPIAGLVAAFAGCVAFILAVKYAQLFFPPRTVTLNYVLAQSLGALAGIVLFAVLRRPLTGLARTYARLENLRTLLRLYTGLIILFLLMPLDFAVTVQDLAVQRAQWPDSLIRIAGEGRPPFVRAAVLFAGALAAMPIGAMLTITGGSRAWIGRSTAAATALGLCLMTAVYALTTLVIGAAPSLPAVALHTAGIALGAEAFLWLSRRDLAAVRRSLARLVPWTVPFYLAAAAMVNGLISTHWQSPREGWAQFYEPGIVPLFNYYIVTKAQAAKNIAGHAAMYAPIGIAIWLRAREGGGKAMAFVLAALLSALVEAGRFLRPGLVPDINAIPLAGAAAWATCAAMPGIWRILGTVAAGRARGPSTDRDGDDDGGPREISPMEATGDVEEY